MPYMPYIKTQPLTQSQVDTFGHLLDSSASYYGDELTFMVKAGLFEQALRLVPPYLTAAAELKGADISKKVRPTARGFASYYKHLQALQDGNNPPSQQPISSFALGLLLYSHKYSVLSDSMSYDRKDFVYSAKQQLVEMGFLHEGPEEFTGAAELYYTHEGALIIESLVQEFSLEFQDVDVVELLVLYFMAYGGLQSDVDGVFPRTREHWSILAEMNWGVVDGGRLVCTDLGREWFSRKSRAYPYSTLGQFNLLLVQHFSVE